MPKPNRYAGISTEDFDRLLAEMIDRENAKASDLTGDCRMIRTICQALGFAL